MLPDLKSSKKLKNYQKNGTLSLGLQKNNIFTRRYDGWVLFGILFFLISHTFPCGFQEKSWDILLCLKIEKNSIFGVQMT